MAGAYVHTPQGPEFLAAELRDLKAKVAGLQRALNGIGLQVDPDTNSLVVSSGRAIRVTDTGGNIVAIIGTQPGLQRSDGSPQAGVSLYREDGSIAAFLGDATPTVAPFKQSWQVYDRAGNVVMADDTNGGKGLANPWVTGGLVLADTNTASWAQTTSASFIDIAAGYFRPENPRVQWVIEHVADASTAGQLKLLINGVQVDTTQTISSSFTYWTRYNVALPAGVNIGDTVAVELQARRSSGTGIVYASLQMWMGDQSP